MPLTKAGQRLLDNLFISEWTDPRQRVVVTAAAIRRAIDAIETEAREQVRVNYYDTVVIAKQQERARIRAAVEELEAWPRVSWFAYDAKLRDGTPLNPTEDRVVVERAAVLAIIDGEGAK